jgi:hypothetical protein
MAAAAKPIEIALLTSHDLTLLTICHPERAACFTRRVEGPHDGITLHCRIREFG